MVEHIYRETLHELEDEVNYKISSGKYELINITFCSVSAFSECIEKDGWYAILKKIT